MNGWKSAPAPALDHDAMMKREYNHDVSETGRIERVVVWNLLQYIASEGFTVAAVDDGDEETKVVYNKDAMELVFDLDIAHLIVMKGQAFAGTVTLVMGNGTDVVSDYSWRLDAPEFKDVMDEFDADRVLAGLLTEETDGL